MTHEMNQTLGKSLEQERMRCQKSCAGDIKKEGCEEIGARSKRRNTTTERVEGVIWERINTC